MSGTLDGGKRAAATNKRKYEPDFYREIGAKGGKLGKTGGFAAGEAGRERARVYGAVGGHISRRGIILTDAEKALRRSQVETGTTTLPPDDIDIPGYVAIDVAEQIIPNTTPAKRRLFSFLGR